MITEIIENISDCSQTGKKRKAKVRQLQIRPNLEMVFDVEVIYYENDNGNYGDPTLIAINTYNISEGQKKLQKDLFKTQIHTDTTIGFYVNPATGIKTEDPNQGIPELAYWQNIPLSIFEGATTISDVVYGALRLSIQNMDARQKF